MHVGLDLGTALTKIARYPADSGQPDSGEPGTAALAIKPSAVSYHQLGSEIPAFSSAGEQPPLTVRCDGFPLMLESRPQGCVNIWGGRTAAEVTQAYLRCLLAADELGDGELVVAVPAHAATLVSTGGLFGSPRPASARPLPQVQAAVPDILTALGRPPSRVVAAPVAAVAYLRHTRPELKDVTRFIVCDIGAGAISFALCEVGSRATRLADCVRLTDSAVWNADSGGFTEAMDVSCPVVERLIIELARKVGTPPRDWSARRWRGLEWLLRQHGDWPSIVRNADGPLGPPQGDTEQPIADLRVTTDQLLAVCSPLARRGAEALRSIIRGQQKDDWRVTGRRTGPKIVFLGGLGGLGPVRAALLKAAGADPAYPGDAEVRLDAETRLGAVAQGAALVAAGEVRLSQPYPHALRLPVHYIAGERLESAELELAPAGTIEYEQPERMLVDAQGDPLTVQVRAGTVPFPLQVVPHGSGQPVPARFKSAAAPLAGHYRVALGGGVSGVTIALHPVGGGSAAVRMVLNESTDLSQRRARVEQASTARQPSTARQAAWRASERRLPDAGSPADEEGADPMARLGRVPRWLAVVAAAGAVLCSAVLCSALPAAAGVASTPASAVAADLGADNIPAALVILVDVSDSMAPPEGLYPSVYQQLPKFLAALARQDPQDQVSVVQFASRAATTTIAPMGPPTPDIPLLQDPGFSGGTDIGYAFQVALDDLAQDKTAQVGGVLLLSDGGLSAPSDPVYDGGEGYEAPGWAALRKQVAGLGIPVTGYGLPLTTDQGDISALDEALTACFGSQQVTLTSDNDLSSQFDTAQQKILNTRVAAAAAPDSGKGVRVSWGGAADSDGTVRLNPATGQALVSVTFTSTTSKIPLSVAGVSVTASGFPEKISASGIPSTVTLKPGQSRTVPVRLAWTPLTAGPFPPSGTMSVHARVTSPDTNAIRNFYDDAAFTVGGLTGQASVPYAAAIPAASHAVLLIVLVLLLLLAVAGAVLYSGARLSGSLSLGAVGEGTVRMNLPRKPRYTFPVSSPGGISGQITIWRKPFKPEMRIRHSRNPDATFTLPPGGRMMLAGIEVSHGTGHFDDSRVNF